MARIAGLKLIGRLGDWLREPFTNKSRSHILLWQKEK
jgi:hypothetical protein